MAISSKANVVAARPDRKLNSGLGAYLKEVEQRVRDQVGHLGEGAVHTYLSLNLPFDHPG